MYRWQPVPVPERDHIRQRPLHPGGRRQDLQLHHRCCQRPGHPLPRPMVSVVISKRKNIYCPVLSAAALANCRGYLHSTLENICWQDVCGTANGTVSAAAINGTLSAAAPVNGTAKAVPVSGTTSPAASAPSASPVVPSAASASAAAAKVAQGTAKVAG